MPSLLLVMFILQTVLHIINTVGANTINELVSRAPPTPRNHEMGGERLLTMGYTALGSLQQAPHTNIFLRPASPKAEA